jgi:kanosamine 6-kinase
MIVAAGGPACRCGRRGCLQSIASGSATLRRAGAGTSDARALRGALAAGEAGAVRAVAETASALAAAIVTVSELLHPALVRLGGGFAYALPELCPAVAVEVEALDRPGHPGPRVEPAAFGALSSLAGAVLFAREPWCLHAAEEGVA